MKQNRFVIFLLSLMAWLGVNMGGPAATSTVLTSTTATIIVAAPEVAVTATAAVTATTTIVKAAPSCIRAAPYLFSSLVIATQSVGCMPVENDDLPSCGETITLTLADGSEWWYSSARMMFPGGGSIYYIEGSFPVKFSNKATLTGKCDCSDDASPAPETCDGLDNDCDGDIDNVEGVSWYPDIDGDGYGNETVEGISGCDQPASGYVTNNDDCDDTNGSVHPKQSEACNGIDDNCDGQKLSTEVDEDDDGFMVCAGDCDDKNPAVNPGSSEPCEQTFTDNDQDGVSVENRDCNDDDAAVYPGATEVCDGKDNNCDDHIDEGFDGDGDGFASCEGTPDCNDVDPAINPGAAEQCGDGIDNDCDDTIDDDASDASKWYADDDGDGYGDPESIVQSCDQPVGYVANKNDCNDFDTYTNPAAVEICDTQDNNCDGEIDTVGGEEVPEATYYADADADTYGDPEQVTSYCGLAPLGYVADSSDCNDQSDQVYPGALETCDSVDSDCDGTTSDGVEAIPYYPDGDNDGYGVTGNVYRYCSGTQPVGWVLAWDDCDDSNSSIHPLADEYCNNIDENCNGEVDDEPVNGNPYFADADIDGYGDMTDYVSVCTQPEGRVDNATDCDDTDPDIHPGATEICDNVDQNCNTFIDDSAVDVATFYADTDGDTYGNVNVTTASCSQPDGYVADSSDCDDTKAAINPAAEEVCDGQDNNCDGAIDDTGDSVVYVDSDGDGYGDVIMTDHGCADEPGESGVGGDCDDTDASINPGAKEVCDGLDQNCNGTADENATTAATWYSDADTDGYGDAAVTETSCVQPDGYIADNTDCNDSDQAINPGAEEVCDDTDNDCNGLTDVNAVDAPNWYADGDSDGYGDPNSISFGWCTKPIGYVADNTDCDDGDAFTYPEAAELCDAIDNDCDGEVDEEVTEEDGRTWYADADGDGYGDKQVTQVACETPTGYVADKTDCDDTNTAINPAATETCNGYDDDCDRAVDDEDAPLVGQHTWYRDADGDGYGSAKDATAFSCTAPSGYVSVYGDCDDTNTAINPAATETCNGYDDDCDDTVDDGLVVDTDGDGYNTCTAGGDCNDGDAAIHPGATEVPYDDIDQDCSGADLIDVDGDGYNAEEVDGTDCDDADSITYPGAIEHCNGIDNTCDTVVDEGCASVGYTYTVTPNGEYPDNTYSGGHGQLDDSRYGTSDLATSAYDWVGWRKSQQGNPVGVVFQSAGVRWFDSITIGLLVDEAAGIFQPDQIEVSFSNDGTTFGTPFSFELGVDMAEIPDGTRGDLTLPVSATGQYVQVLFFQPGEWTFVDEFRD